MAGFYFSTNFHIVLVVRFGADHPSPLSTAATTQKPSKRPMRFMNNTSDGLRVVHTEMLHDFINLDTFDFMSMVVFNPVSILMCVLH